MKILHKLLILVTVSIFLGACNNDDDFITLNPNATTTVSSSVSSVVLSADAVGQDALTISWTEPDFGYNAAASYKILMDKEGGDFSSAVSISTGTELSKVFKTEDFNKLLLNLGFEGDTASNLLIKVQVFLSEYKELTSEVITVNATAYLDKLDLSTTWGVVGSATTNGWNGPDMPFYQTSVANVLVAYVTLADGEIKFRENNDWANNYGDDGADGSLESGGANITVAAGTYKITFNLNDLTYTIESYSWGLVGSATTNGWGGPDMPLMYDSYSDTWKAVVTLTDGEIKIRQNNDWGVNYGDDGVDGTLEANGANIAVSAGNYLVTVDFNSFEYTLEAIDIWGVVGSATPNGWDGPDTKFTPDFANDGVWILNGMSLTDGEIKFRLNDDWAVNYGDDGADGSLEAGGANIAVSAGSYNITLDFSDPNAPTYIMTQN